MKKLYMAPIFSINDSTNVTRPNVKLFSQYFSINSDLRQFPNFNNFRFRQFCLWMIFSSFHYFWMDMCRMIFSYRISSFFMAIPSIVSRGSKPKMRYFNTSRIVTCMTNIKTRLNKTFSQNISKPMWAIFFSFIKNNPIPFIFTIWSPYKTITLSNSSPPKTIFNWKMFISIIINHFKPLFTLYIDRYHLVKWVM